MSLIKFAFGAVVFVVGSTMAYNTFHGWNLFSIVSSIALAIVGLWICGKK